MVVPKSLAVAFAHCSFLFSMNCRTTARASDPILTIPRWMDSIPPFRTSACDGFSSLPCSWPHARLSRAHCGALPPRARNANEAVILGRSARRGLADRLAANESQHLTSPRPMGVRFSSNGTKPRHQIGLVLEHHVEAPAGDAARELTS